jgi:hypothetical protein
MSDKRASELRDIQRKRQLIAQNGLWAITRAGERVKVMQQDGKLVGALYACNCKSPFTEWTMDGVNELARCDDLVQIDGVPSGIRIEDMHRAELAQGEKLVSEAGE